MHVFIIIIIILFELDLNQEQKSAPGYYVIMEGFIQNFPGTMVKLNGLGQQWNDSQLQIPCVCPEEVQYVADLQNGNITGSN